MYEYTARPSCPYAYDSYQYQQQAAVLSAVAGGMQTSRVGVVLELRLGYLIRGAVV